MPHDKANSYAASHRFSVNEALGVFEVRNETALEQLEPSLATAASKEDQRLFAHVSGSELAHSGSTGQILPIEAWREVAQYLPTEATREAVDPSDLVAAMERTPDQVVFVSGHQELQKILAHPFAFWRIFLHPLQRRITYAPTMPDLRRSPTVLARAKPSPRFTGPHTWPGSHATSSFQHIRAPRARQSC